MEHHKKINRVMEPETIQKNGIGLKSRMKKVILTITIFTVSIVCLKAQTTNECNIIRQLLTSMYKIQLISLD